MFKILFCLTFDAVFTYMLIAFWDELGVYFLLPLGAIALFTFELVRAIKDL